MHMTHWSYDIVGNSFAIHIGPNANLQWLARFPDDIFDKPVRSPHGLAGDVNVVVEPTGREVVGMPEAIPCFRRVLAEQVREACDNRCTRQRLDGSTLPSPYTGPA